AADTLALGYVLGATPCTRDFHPLERAHAERTKKSSEETLSPGGFLLGERKTLRQFFFKS
ncbi:MAG: hypothetical protein KIC91_09785, partial [Sutterella sp.]|nr:hypothetical protein [Sutterella sp.]